MRLEHVGIEVSDLYAMELFYRTALGFSLEYRYVSQNSPGLRSVFLRSGGFALELLERPRDPGFLSARARARPNHVALSVEDVDAVHRRLLALGLPGALLRPPRDTGDGFREAELVDPEGNLLELSQRVRPPPRYPVRAVIFDWDGTLIDSEPNYYLADAKLLARYGLPFTEEDKRRYIGGSNIDEMTDFKRRFALEESPQELAALKNRLYLEIAESSTRLFPEMKRFLDGVRARGLKVAVASGSAPAVLGRLLAAVGLTGAFGAVVSADEVLLGKPAPDVFLEAARRLGVAPEECVVVEDARYGVEAALRAFMRCIAVPYLSDPPLDPAFGVADLLFAGGMSTFEADRALAFVESALPPA
ncbi:MAG TPA: HAD-IA family hydrolase [Anaeromyxobacteraceae bacterium]|nr:HAD-IA family hydrolase [Anaeromyxobacteraceae bacterium]